MLDTASQFVKKITCKEEWLEYLQEFSRAFSAYDALIDATNLSECFLVEELISGQERQIDGYVLDGKLHCCAIGVKEAEYTRHGFREARGMLYAPLTMNDRQTEDRNLIDWTQRVLTVLGYRNGTFHMELMLMANGEFRLIEINPRTGGGGNVFEIGCLSGIDLNQECLALWAGLSRHSEVAKEWNSVCFAVRYPKKPGRVAFVRKEEEVMEPLVSSHIPLQWGPYASKETLLDPDKEEQYLAVLLAPNFCAQFDQWDAISSKLSSLIYSDDYLREEP